MQSNRIPDTRRAMGTTSLPAYLDGRLASQRALPGMAGILMWTMLKQNGPDSNRGDRVVDSVARSGLRVLPKGQREERRSVGHVGRVQGKHLAVLVENDNLYIFRDTPCCCSSEGALGNPAFV